MAVRKRGDSWMADFMVKGQRYRETFDTEPEAVAWEHEARAALTLGKSLPPVRNQRVDQPGGGGLSTLGALLDYTEREHWRNNPKISEPETAVRNARFAVEFFGRNTLVKTITKEEMQRLVKHEVAQGRSYATADRRLASLSKMLAVAVEKGVIPRKPPIPLTNDTGERLRYLTKDEARALLQLWRDWQQPDLYAFTVFGLHTGARLESLLQVKWKQFGPGLATVMFTNGDTSRSATVDSLATRRSDKKSKVRTLKLSPVTIAALEDMRSRYPGSTGPFMHMKKDGHLRTMWDKMQAYFGWDDVVIHTLRHTCATWMLEQTGDLVKVKDWLGHLRIETTLKYAKLIPGATDGMADMMNDALTLDPPAPKLRVVGG